MYIDLNSRSTSSALIPRGNRPEVRNPVLALPCAARAQSMPPEARRWLIDFLHDLRNEARTRAAESLRKHKAPLYLYWKVVGVWAAHLGKALRAGQPITAANKNQ